MANMSKKMINLAKRIHNLFVKYYQSYCEENNRLEDSIYIKNHETGEIMIFARDYKSVLDLLPILKMIDEKEIKSNEENKL